MSVLLPGGLGGQPHASIGELDTFWKFQDFTATLILRAINFGLFQKVKK